MAARSIVSSPCTFFTMAKPSRRSSHSTNSRPGTKPKSSTVSGDPAAGGCEARQSRGATLVGQEQEVVDVTAPRIAVEVRCVAFVLVEIEVEPVDRVPPPVEPEMATIAELGQQREDRLRGGARMPPFGFHEKHRALALDQPDAAVENIELQPLDVDLDEADIGEADVVEPTDFDFDTLKWLAVDLHDVERREPIVLALAVDGWDVEDTAAGRVGQCALAH